MLLPHNELVEESLNADQSLLEGLIQVGDAAGLHSEHQTLADRD